MGLFRRTSDPRRLNALGNEHREAGRLAEAIAAYRDALRAAPDFVASLYNLGTCLAETGAREEAMHCFRRVAELEPNGRPAEWPDIKKLLPAGYRYAGGPMVQWDTPIPPPEAYELLAKMSTFEEATDYKVGESYLGKDIWAMDLMPKLKASHWSQAKATTLKPTVVYSARQHANEISSISHVLKLAELLLTDPEYKRKLEKVNVVIHPITNPDGAQLAYDMQKVTPNHMLHAGYLGSLGVDMTSGQNDADPIYPETRVRPGKPEPPQAR